MAKFIVVEPGYLKDKLWQVGEVIESAEPLPPSTWYHAEGGKPLPKGNIDAADALMNKPSDAPASAQDIKALQDALTKLGEKDQEIAELKGQLQNSKDDAEKLKKHLDKK
jgi:hypothetical protein